MSLPCRVRWLLPALAVLVLGLPAALSAAEFPQYKDLRNDYLKVIDLRERDRTEERYMESGGKVTLQRLPYKELTVTAELVQKPPSTMSTMFDSSKEPYFRICLLPFDNAGNKQEEDCQTFRFQSLVRGNVGTASFRLPADLSRYELHLTQKLANKGTGFKLWTPRD